MQRFRLPTKLDLVALKLGFDKYCKKILKFLPKKIYLSEFEFEQHFEAELSCQSKSCFGQSLNARLREVEQKSALKILFFNKNDGSNALQN